MYDTKCFFFVFVFIKSTQYDVQHTKRALMQYIDKAGPDQPAHLHRLIWAFIVNLKNQWIL